MFKLMQNGLQSSKIGSKLASEHESAKRQLPFPTVTRASTVQERAAGILALSGKFTATVGGRRLTQ